MLVLLATYNGAARVQEQIASLAEQQGVNVTVLLGDDGSSDGTVQLSLQSADAAGLRVQVLPPVTNSGSAAQNFFRLFREADFRGYDGVALCDQDDIWLPNKLARAWKCLVDANADAYSCNSLAFWPSGTVKTIRKDYRQRRFDHWFESASHGCTYVLTAESAGRLQKALAIDRQCTATIEFHDWWIYAWARSHGMRWFMDSEFLIRYRQTNANVIGANAGFDAAMRRVSMLRGGWLRRQAVQIAACCGMADDPLIQRLRTFHWRDRIYLAAHAHMFRRRPRDQLVFALACLTVGI